jgi:hypothetical protein
MLPVTNKSISTEVAKSQTTDEQQAQLSIDQHLKDIETSLDDNTINKDLIARKINIIKKSYPHNSLKNSLKKIEDLLKQRYEQKTHMDINFHEIHAKKAEKDLTPLINEKCKQTDDILAQFKRHIDNNTHTIEFLCNIQDKLKNIDDSIHKDILNKKYDIKEYDTQKTKEILQLSKDITTKIEYDIPFELLLKLSETIGKINNTQDSIQVLLKKEIISSQLKNFTPESPNQTKAEYLQNIIESTENYDIFETFPAFYKQLMKDYLSSIDADYKNFDYDLTLTKIKDVNATKAQSLKQKEAIKLIEVLKENIMTLAEQLEKIKDVRTFPTTKI